MVQQCLTKIQTWLMTFVAVFCSLSCLQTLPVLRIRSAAITDELVRMRAPTPSPLLPGSTVLDHDLPDAAVAYSVPAQQLRDDLSLWLSPAERAVANTLLDYDDTSCLVFEVDVAGPDGVRKFRLPFVPDLRLPAHLDTPLAAAARPNSGEFVPKSIRHISSSPHKAEWQQALEQELANLKDSWHWTPLPPGKTACRQVAVLKAKQHADGTLDKFRIRFCLDGSSMSRDEMGETYQPVATLDSVRLMASCACQRGDDLIQCDFDAAFLCGDMPYELYARPPSGVPAPVGPDGKPMVLSVTGNQYGHPKAPLIFGTLLHELFMAFGSVPGCTVVADGQPVRRGLADVCSYRFTCGAVSVNCVSYVDDTLWQVPRTKAARQLFDKIVDHINGHGKLRIGEDASGARRGQPVRSFLGMLFEYDVDKGVLRLSMPAKIDEVIERANLSDAFPKFTPGEPGTEASLADCPPDGPAGAEHRAVMDNIPYRSLLMSVMWIARGVRPDIQHQTSALSRVMHKPGVEHWRRLKHLIRYLKGTRDEKLTYTRDPSLPPGELPVWIAVDASYLPDYGAEFDNYKSTTGWVAFGPTGQAVAWRARRQSLFADSTCVAEYLAAADAAKMAVHLRLMMSDFGYPQLKPTVIMEDNQACIKVANKWCNHDRTKHVDAHAHVLRDLIARDVVEMQHVSTELQPADALTKNLPRPCTAKYRAWLLRGIVPPSLLPDPAPDSTP